MKNLFVETRNVQAATSVARDLESAEAGVPGLALIHGQRGLGKTRWGIWYAAQTGAVYVRAKSIWTPTWLLEELAVELSIVPQKRKQYLFTSVQDALKEQPRLIIIDETNIPPQVCLNCVRDLHDLTGVPFLLIGHEGIIDRLRRMGPFFDRFLYITEFKPVGQQDLETFCASCLEVPITKETVGHVLKSTSGNFRKAVVAFKGAEDRAKLNRAKEITLAHLKAA